MDTDSKQRRPTSQTSDKKLLPVAYSELTTDLILKAKMELNETEETMKERLKLFKELISADSVTCCPRDDFLLWFLRARKYDLKRSLKSLKTYCHVRRSQMKFMRPISFERIVKVLDAGACGILPKRDQEGRVTIFFCASNFSSHNCNPDDAMKTTLLLCHFVLIYPASQVNGACILADASVPSLEALRVIFKYARIFIPVMHEFPMRIKRIDCVNANLIFRAAFHVLRALLPTKLFQRTELHGEQADALDKIYPLSILPQEMGGSAGSYKDLYKDWINEFKKYVGQFYADNKFYETP